MRPDYIWIPESTGRKALKAGYYHLTTQEAYIGVYSKLKKANPLTEEICPIQKKRDRQLYAKVKEVMENRLMCDVPNDIDAARMRICHAVPIRRPRRVASGKRIDYMPALTAIALSSSTHEQKNRSRN